MILIQQLPEIEQFKKKLRNLLIKEMAAHPTINITKNTSIYTVENKNTLVYFIESGQVIKLFAPSSQSKEHVLATRSSGDIFGESSIGNLGKHLKTAIAVTDTSLKAVSSSEFLTYLDKGLLLQDFIQYLTIQVIYQQQIIANIISSHNDYVS